MKKKKESKERKLRLKDNFKWKMKIQHQRNSRFERQETILIIWYFARSFSIMKLFSPFAAFHNALRFLLLQSGTVLQLPW